MEKNNASSRQLTTKMPLTLQTNRRYIRISHNTTKFIPSASKPQIESIKSSEINAISNQTLTSCALCTVPLLLPKRRAMGKRKLEEEGVEEEEEYDFGGACLRGLPERGGRKRRWDAKLIAFVKDRVKPVRFRYYILSNLQHKKCSQKRRETEHENDWILCVSLFSNKP